MKVGPPANWERKGAWPAGTMVIWRGCELLAFHHFSEWMRWKGGTGGNEVDVDVSAVEAGEIERVYGVAHLGSNVEITRAAFWVAVS